MNHKENSELADAAFVPGPDDEPDFSVPALPPVDRSTAEPYSVCPRQGRLLESGRLMIDNHAINVGNAVHLAFSKAIAAYIDAASDTQTYMKAHDLAECVKSYLMESRPDVQPDAIAAAMPSVWAWSQFLAGGWDAEKYPGIAAHNILHYDGGIGERSGQLGWPLHHLGVTATSEVDLLVATESPVLLREIDYKSGRSEWTESKIAASFQFTLHAVLVFERYRSCEALDVAVWQTRWNEPTKPVRFLRERLQQYRALVANTYAERAKWINTPADQVEAWPGIEKCSACAAAKLCVIPPPESCVKDPAAFLVAMHNLSNRLDAMKAEATEFVDAHGEIYHADGIAFGRQKPAETRKKPVSFYQLEEAKESTPPAEPIAPEPTAVDLLVAAGGTMKAESEHGSVYFVMPDGSEVRVSDHGPNDATDKWMRRNKVASVRTDRPGWRKQVDKVLERLTPKKEDGDAERAN